MDEAKWSQDEMVEVNLAHPDDFLKVKETLTRIGIASNKEHKLYQSCHILHKQGRYYIVHFKELFILDGRDSTLSLDDVQRRNTIASLLNKWGLLTVLNTEQIADQAPLNFIKILGFQEKGDWELIAKYRIGRKDGNQKAGVSQDSNTSTATATGSER